MSKMNIEVTEDVKLEQNDELKLLDLDIKEEYESANFEMVYLPETYEGVRIDTPFFDYDLYKNKLEEIEEEFPLNFQQENIDHIHTSYHPYRHTNNEEISCFEQNLEFGEKNGRTNSKLKYQYQIKSKKKSIAGSAENGAYICPLCEKERRYYTVVALNNHLRFEHMSFSSNCDKVTEKENKNNYKVNVTSTETASETEANPKNYTINEGNKKIIIENDFQMDSFKIRKMLDLENGDYKCPLCKTERTYFTVEAVNNHLKFDHLAIFNIKKGLCSDKISSSSDKNSS